LAAEIYFKNKSKPDLSKAAPGKKKHAKKTKMLNQTIGRHSRGISKEIFLNCHRRSRKNLDSPHTSYHQKYPRKKKKKRKVSRHEKKKKTHPHHSRGNVKATTTTKGERNELRNARFRRDARRPATGWTLQYKAVNSFSKEERQNPEANQNGKHILTISRAPRGRRKDS